MQIFTRAVAGTFECSLPDISDASPAPSLVLYDGSGTELLGPVSMTRDTTATTLTAAAVAGKLDITVASATGMVRGREYLIGSSALEVRELRRVRRIHSTNVVEIAGPLVYSHASGVAVLSTRVTYSLTSSTFPDVVRYGKAALTYYVGAVQYRVDLPFAVSEHVLDSRSHEQVVQSLMDADPSLLQRVSRGLDLVGPIERARRVLNADIRRSFEPFLLRGLADEYAEAHTLLTLAQLADADRPDDAKRWRDLYSAELGKATTLATVDHDDDNAVSPEEAQHYHARQWARA